MFEGALNTNWPSLHQTPPPKPATNHQSGHIPHTQAAMQQHAAAAVAAAAAATTTTRWADPSTGATALDCGRAPAN